MHLLSRLWHGEVALTRAFWECGMLYGSLANLAATIVAFAVLAVGWPPVLALTIFFLPVPYNVLIVVAVWRSASRHDGSRLWANLARLAVVVWAVVAALA
jgi:hypothetical protein